MVSKDFGTMFSFIGDAKDRDKVTSPEKGPQEEETRVSHYEVVDFQGTLLGGRDGGKGRGRGEGNGRRYNGQLQGRVKGESKFVPQFEGQQPKAALCTKCGSQNH
jgi:hypothetical protein